MMGSQLWTSPVTGYRRRGTRLAELDESLFRRITAQAMYEPLLSALSADPASEVRTLLNERDFDVAGVRDSASGRVVGFVRKVELGVGSVGDHLLAIGEEDWVLPGAHLSELLERLKYRDCLFVSVDGGIEGILTLADLNKPIVRVYLFGLMTLLEMHLHFWVRSEYPDDSWRAHMTQPRLDEVDRLQVEHPEVSAFDLLQFGDRGRLLVINSRLRELVGARSREQIERKINAARRLRDDLAHSQYYLSTPERWPKVIDVVQWVERFLTRSDQLVEHQAGVEAGVSPL